MTLNVVVTGTAPLFSLEEAKQHLQVEVDDDDVLIGSLGDAAVARVLQHCNLSLVPDGDIPEAAFKAAALLLLRTYYDNRSVILPAGAVLSTAVTDLVDPYRWLRV